MQMRVSSPQLQIDLQPLLFRLSIVQVITNGCCDFIAQCTLVHINYCTYHTFYPAKSFKDLPLLDRVGQKYPRRDRSLILGNHIHRSVNLSSFNNPILI